MKKIVLFTLILGSLCFQSYGLPLGFEPSRLGNYAVCMLSPTGASPGFSLVPLRVKPAFGWTGNGPYGGLASRFLYDAQNPGVLYAGSQYAGVFKSTDFGERWFPIGLENTYRTEGLVSPRSAPNVLYENAEVLLPFGPNLPSAVFRSTDYGATWAFCNNGLHSIFYDLAVSPTSPDTLYAAGATGSGYVWKESMMRTTDGGSSWFFKGFFPDTTYFIVDLVVADDSFHTVYAGTGFMLQSDFIGGVWKSTDAGETWEPRNNGFPSGSNHYWISLHGGLGVNPFNSSELYCAMAYDTGGGRLVWGLYKTTDGGGVWTSVKPQGWTSFTWPNWPTVDLRDTSIIYWSCLDSGVVKSTDQGQSWRIVNGTGLPTNGRNAGMSCLGQEPWGGQRFWASNARLQSGDGVFVSSDYGETWSQKIQGFSAAEVNAVAIDPFNPSTLYSATSMGGAYKTMDAGSNWTAINDSLYIPWSDMPYYNRETLLSMAVARRTPGFVLVGCDGDGVFKTTNGGQRWFYSGQGMPDVMSYTLSVDALVFDPRSDSMAYAGLCMWQHGGWSGWGVYKTTDAGALWQRRNSGFGGDTAVTSLAIARSAPDIIYAGAQKGVYKSTNGGGAWQRTSVGPDSVISLCVNFWDSQIIYAGTWTHGLFRSTDGGASWVQCNNGLPSLFVRTIVCDTLHPGRQAVGTGAGVFWSDDWGENWREVGSGLTSVWGLTFQYLPVDSVKIYAGTCSRGVLSNTMAVGVEEFSLSLETIPFTSFHFSPNPMREGCEISFALPLAGRANLAIYDPLGRMVRMCLDGKSKAGFHKMFWDGRDGEGHPLPSGVYFLRLEAGGFTKTNKLVIVR
jgi:photosystem II stability/assembly factor-like uncharacterized protein